MPVEYTNSLGKQGPLPGVLTEWEDLTEEQRATLNALGEDPFWVGYGDRILNSQEMQSASVLDQQQAVFDQVAEDLPRRGTAALTQAGQAPSTAVYHGSAISCVPGGANGQ